MMTSASDRHAARPVFRSGSILIVGSARASVALHVPVHGAYDVFFSPGPGGGGRGSYGILTGMTMTTIKVPKATRDRLHRLAAADGVTLAQEIDKLVREHALRPRPATGGFRSSRPLTAEEIDGQLAAGFGE